MRLLVIAEIAPVLLLLAANLAPVYGSNNGPIDHRCRSGGQPCVSLAKRKEKTFQPRDRCCHLDPEDECRPNNKCPYERPDPCRYDYCRDFKKCHVIGGKAVCKCRSCTPGEYKPVCALIQWSDANGFFRPNQSKTMTFDSVCLFERERCIQEWGYSVIKACPKGNSSVDGDDESTEILSSGDMSPSESSTIRPTSTVPNEPLQKGEENEIVKDAGKAGAQSHQVLLIHTKIDGAVVLMISTLLPLLMLQ